MIKYDCLASLGSVLSVCDLTMSTPASNRNNNGSPKRVRTEQADNPPAERENDTTQSSKSPSKAAVAALNRALETLPTSLEPIISHYGRQIITCRSKLYNKRSMQKKMADDKEYIPKSAKATDFKPTLSKAAEDDNAVRLEFLNAQVEQMKDTYQKSLRSVIEECIEFEATALEKEEKELTSDLLHTLSAATAEHEGATCDAHLRVVNLLKLDKNLFKHSPDKTVDAIGTHYKQHHSVTVLPTATLVIANTSANADAEEQLAALREQALSEQLPENKGLTLFRRCIKTILIIPTESFLGQHTDNQRTLALKKMATNLIDGKTTEETAMELDAEPTASLGQLQDLVKQEIDKRDKKYKELEKNYRNLEKKLGRNSNNNDNYNRNNSNSNKRSNNSNNRPPKNSTPRGRGRGASGKNKSGNRRDNNNNNNNNNNRYNRSRSNSRGRNRRNNKNNAQADDDNNASNRGNRSNSGRRSRSRSNRNNSRSNTRRN